MGRKTVIRSLAAITILSSLLFLYFYFNPSPPSPDLQPHEGLGEVLAEEAIKALGPKGKISMVTRDTETFRMPAVDAQVEGFRRGVKKAGKTISASRSVKVDALRIVAAPPGEFFEMLRRSSPDDVIVSFVGPPQFNAEQLERLTGSPAKIVAVCPGSMPTREALESIFGQKLLQSAVVSLQVAGTYPPAGETPRAAFQRVFKTITPQNVSELPMAHR